MTIEDAFRAEKSYETRSENTDLVIGTNGYGQFTYDLTVTSNSCLLYTSRHYSQ